MSNSIVVYYTWSGNTRKIAKIIASLVGADIQEILPETPYTKNYNKAVEQAKKEIREGFHPPIKKMDLDLSKYDVVYIGTPIWWSTIAPPVATFLSKNDFSGKTIMPFSTHGGGGKGQADKDIAKLCPKAKVLDMYTTYQDGRNSAKEEVAAWIKKNRLL